MKSFIFSVTCFFFINFYFLYPTYYLYDERSFYDEREEMTAYLAAFPHKDYTLTFSEDTGYFYLDNLNDIMKNLLRSGCAWEKHNHDLIKKYALPNTTVLDIGAHIGTETILMANCVGVHGKVHAFEPQKKIFRELWENCLINKVENTAMIYRMAIGNTHSMIEMQELPIYTDGPAKGMVSEGGTGIGKGGDIAEMRTIDSFNFENVSLIKIDVEGAEDAVIEGMLETVKKNRPVIIIEICGGSNYETAPPEIKQMILTTKKKLSNLGYKVSQICTWDYIAIPNEA